MEKANKTHYTYCGTPSHIAPETYIGVPHDYKSDVWALGCVLCKLCTFQKPFAADSSVDLELNIVVEE